MTTKRGRATRARAKTTRDLDFHEPRRGHYTVKGGTSIKPWICDDKNCAACPGFDREKWRIKRDAISRRDPHRALIKPPLCGDCIKDVKTMRGHHGKPGRRIFAPFNLAGRKRILDVEYTTGGLHRFYRCGYTGIYRWINA